MSFCNQYLENKVLDFIQRRFPKARDDKQWVSGNCFYFASILKVRFPEGYIVYDVIEGHFLFLYFSLLVDAVHHEYLTKTFVPSETNFMLSSSIVVWDFLGIMILFSMKES